MRDLRLQLVIQKMNSTTAKELLLGVERSKVFWNMAAFDKPGVEITDKMLY